MIANNNLKVCRTLVRRDVRFHPVKYILLSCAAMLVTALYTFVFLLGSSVENAYLLNYQYSYGSTSHILYTGLTEKQADTLTGNSSIKSTVRLSTIGQLSDPVIGRRSIKLAVTDRAYAQTVLSVPTVGTLPEKNGEIALDEFTMDSLGIPHKIGSPVSIAWTDSNGETHTTAFTLCGWWASPANFSEACAWITKEEAKKLLPDYDEENAANVTLGVNLHQPKDIEKQAEAILSQQGVTGCTYTTNLAFQDARTEMARTSGTSLLHACFSGDIMWVSDGLQHCSCGGRQGVFIFCRTEISGNDTTSDLAAASGTEDSGFCSGNDSRLGAGICPSLFYYRTGGYRNGRESGAVFSVLAAICSRCFVYDGNRFTGIFSSGASAFTQDSGRYAEQRFRETAKKKAEV